MWLVIFLKSNSPSKIFFMAPQTVPESILKKRKTNERIASERIAQDMIRKKVLVGGMMTTVC